MVAIFMLNTILMGVFVPPLLMGVEGAILHPLP